MYQSVFSHNRSSSPTVRLPEPAARLRIDEEVPAAQRNPRAAQVAPPAIAGLSGTRRHPRGMVEFQAPGTSFATFRWQADPDDLPLDHAHTRLSCSKMHSMTLPSIVAGNLEKDWAGRPVLHCFEQTTLAMKRNTAGKDKLGAAMQTMANAEVECKRLAQKYTDFSRDARALLATAQGGANAASGTASPALTNIIQAIWPTLRFRNHAEKQEWVARTMRDPKPFIAQSYDALSLALGRITVAFPLANRDATEEGRPKGPVDRQIIFDQICRADQAYVDTQTLFDEVNIPIDESLLQGHSLLAAYSKPRED